MRPQLVKNLLAGAITGVLMRSDVPIDNSNVPIAAPKVLEHVMEAIQASPSVAVVPVQSAFASKINWTQVGGLVLTSLTIFGIDIDDHTKLQIVEGVTAIVSVGTIIFKTFFSNSVTPSSKG